MPQEFCPNPFFYYRGVPFSGGFRYPHPNCVDADPPVPAGTLVPSLLDKSITQVGCGSFFVVALSAAVEGGPGVSLTASGHRGTAILPPPPQPLLRGVGGGHPDWMWHPADAEVRRTLADCTCHPQDRSGLR